jgi:uncharacterized membrane protein YdjX (TVP38/TMEM64 family)
MHPIIKVSLRLVAIFITLLLVTRLAGWFDLNDIRAWFEQTSALKPEVLVTLVIALLVADLLFSIPTVWVALFAGYFLGFQLGFTAVFAGLCVAAILAYELSRYWGLQLFLKLGLSDSELTQLREDFFKYGSLMLLLSRSAPMLPEITYCLAGAAKIPRLKFIAFFCLGHFPYALLTTYAGSRSNLTAPYPALAALLFLYALLWSAAYLLKRRVQTP